MVVYSDLSSTKRLAAVHASDSYNGTNTSILLKLSVHLIVILYPLSFGSSIMKLIRIYSMVFIAWVMAGTAQPAFGYLL